MYKPKVLINAYSCSPNRGSEPGMGWNWCIHLAKYCELHIITEVEFKDDIEIALPQTPDKNNINFYFNPISKKAVKMVRNQGDWRFYYYYRRWQKDTLKIAKQIIAENDIDIIHQLNMIGFREPGNLWKIKGKPYVWGPIGGLKKTPIAYLKGSNVEAIVLNYIKNIITTLQLKYDIRVHKAFKRADLLISAIPDSQISIFQEKKLTSILIPETGTFISEDVEIERFFSEELNVMWVGRFYFRKQLPLALKSIAATKNKKIILHVYGKGNEVQEQAMRKMANDLKISNQVIWHGNKPNAMVHEAMRNANLFFFTSISEDTSTVILEAISNKLPILCFDACGFGAVVNVKVGRKIKFSNPTKSIDQFSEYLNMFHDNRALLKKLSQNCRELQIELSWDEKAKKVVDLYFDLLKKKGIWAKIKQ